MTAIDIAQMIKDRFRPAVKAAGSRYFLVKVDRVAINPKDPNQFRVHGERLDTGEQIQVFSKKSSSGQKLPVAGEVMRADKAMSMQTEDPKLNAYRSEYFYSYGQDSDSGASFCLDAIVMPTTPRLDTEKGMWNAKVIAIDPLAATDMPASAFIDGSLDLEIAKLLRPWESDAQSKVTHDVMGRSLWGEGVDAVQGITPIVTVRFEGDQSVRLYGSGAVKSEESTTKNTVYRLPTIEETMAHIAGNKMLNTLKDAFKGVTVDQIKDYGVAIIPGIALSVGNNSLGGQHEKYLKVPDQFKWKNEKKPDANGLPTVIPGFRDANIHIKASRTGRMIVVDAVPALNGSFSRGIPLTPSEISRKNNVAPVQQAAPAQQAQAAAPAQMTQAATPEQRQPVAAQVQQAQPDEDQYPPMDDYNDYSEYAHDLASMNEISADFFDDNEADGINNQSSVQPEIADDYLEAQIAAAKKLSGPRM